MKEITVSDASKKYKIPERTIRKYISDGLLKHKTIPLGKTRIYVLDEASVKKITNKRPRRGRPPIKT